MAEEKKSVMTDELAQSELERWADYHDIDLFVTGADGNKILDAGAAKLVKAIKSGVLVLNEKNEWEYTVGPRSPAGYAGEKITIKAPTGAAYMAMDKFKEQESFHKTAAMLSAITGQEVSWFSKIDNYDFKILSLVAGFFTAG